MDELSNDDVKAAIDEVIGCVGVRQDVPCHDLIRQLRAGDVAGCVERIAARMGLPVRVDLSFISNDFNHGSTGGFSSHELVNTDRWGQGTAAIVAQVSRPVGLPVFGSSALRGFPIPVRVSAQCSGQPHTFIAVMVHELSHVLLACLCFPCPDSELHADLLPVVLGFSDIVRAGRKTSWTSSDGTATFTTRYGYLTDAQFAFACKYVQESIVQRERDKEGLRGLVAQVRRRLADAQRHYSAFRDYFEYLDKNPPKTMDAGDAQRVVELHARDHTKAWEGQMTAAIRDLESAELFDPYAGRAPNQLAAHINALRRVLTDLRQTTAALTENERILRRYVGCVGRLRATIAVLPLVGKRGATGRASSG